MNAIRDLSAVCRLLPAALLILAPVSSPAGEEPEGEAACGVVAEVWPFEAPAGEAAKPVFELWRASVPPAPAVTVPLNGLSLPARGEAAMTRVAGVLVPPVTGRYAFFVEGPGGRGAKPAGETELWIEEADTGAWTLAQRTGNPNKRSGRTWMEADIARRFELCHLGREAVSIGWEVRDWDAAAGKPAVALARQTVPAGALRSREAAGDDRRDVLGPDGPWGDPDGDGLPNWRERLAGADPLKADAAGRAGLVLWELWRGIPGRHVFDLKRAADYPAGSRETRYLDRLEIPTGNGDAYGSRVRGWLCPPADGEYVFKIIADDTAELWLGEDESWQTRRLIAQANQPPGSARLGWTRGGPDGAVLPLRDEQTARVALRAGQRYYLEILHKQDGGQDHCAVAWILPGAEEPELIGGRHLVAWQPCPTDTDDDGLPDDWQRAAGLLDAKVDAALRHAEADPDGDGATNRDEWKAGTDPLDRADTPDTGGMLLSEAWTGVPGRSVASLTGHPRFPASPDVTTRIDNLDFGREGDNYGVRLRGYLTAPADGAYHFSIAGNNACVLYLGESEDKFAKRPVARVEVGTQWRSFQFGGHLRSGPVPLRRGERYYIEVLFKRGDGGDGKADHSSVAWRRPGEQLFTVIGPGFFSPYRPGPRDGDDDDMPDDWEKLHGLDPADPTGNNGAWGDPDGDGLENFREFQRGLDPNAADVHGTPGLALWEAWDNLAGLPDVHRDGPGLAPALLADLRFPFHPPRREWRDALEAPRRQGANFGARLRAHIIAPVSGEYVFSIAGRDVGELYISPDASKSNRSRVASFRHGTAFRSWDRRPVQMSKPVRLEAGEIYYMEALYARGPFPYDDDFFSIGWKPPGAGGFSLIGERHLIAFDRDPNDLDDDDLPDDWEKANGLDPADPRGANGAWGDPDGDGLANLEEHRSGTRADRADTDGDGISDYDEIHVYGTNPLVSDITPPVKVADVDLAAPRIAAGSWHSGPEGTLVATARRGAVEFEVDLEKPGIYVIRVEAVAHSSAAHIPAAPLAVEIDSRRIGLMEVAGAPSARGWLTPTLAAGRHLIRLENRNVTLGVNLEILAVEIHFHEGSTPGSEAFPAWLAAFHATRNSVAEAPLASPVSPLCLEGVARHPFQVSVATAHSVVAAAEGLTGQWYADVPLDPLQPAALTVSFENGAHTAALAVEWSATNLFETAEPMLLRAGESVKFIALPQDATGNEARVLSLDGEVHYEGAADTPQIITFDQPADHVLTAKVTTPSGPRVARLEVKVIRGDFGPPVATPLGTPRLWQLPAIDRRLELAADPALALREMATHENSPREVELNLATHGPADPRVTARLPGGGAIAAATAIPAFRVVDSARTLDAHVVNILPDGTRVVEIGILIEGPIPPDLLLTITLIVPDAVFVNGDTRIELRTSDFDEHGIARLTIHKAPGTGVAAVCHTLDIGQDPAVEIADPSDTEAGD